MPDVGDKGSNRKAANSLLALSSAAVLTIYGAGYVRTRGAAERFSAQTEARRPAPEDHHPAASQAGPPAPPVEQEPNHLAKTPSVEVNVHTRARLAHSARRSRGIATPNTHGGQAPSAPLTPLAPAPSAPPAPSALPAPAPPAPTAPSSSPLPSYRDGTYFGWGTSRHGDIQAAVVIDKGRIASATIAQCLTRYSCSVIARLPPQVAERQSPEVDYVSGATQSTNAFYYAVVEALGQAKAK
jgi:uncharacterized protein with FMN-binding domain